VGGEGCYRGSAVSRDPDDAPAPGAFAFETVGERRLREIGEIDRLQLARLRFDCFVQAQQFSRPAPQPDAGVGGMLLRQGVGVDEALEIAAKIEAWCLRDLEGL